MDDVLDCIIINHCVCGSGPGWIVIPLPKALVHWSLWKHFRWGNISPVSSCMICDVYLYYHNIPGVTSPCPCVCVCVRFLGWACISFTWPPLCLRRKQHATVLFMVFHVSPGPILVAQPWQFPSSKEGKNIFPSFFVPCLSLHFHCNFISAATPFPPPSSQSWTQSFVVSEGRQATTGSRWPVQAWEGG